MGRFAMALWFSRADDSGAIAGFASCCSAASSAVWAGFPVDVAYAGSHSVDGY